MTYTLRNYNVPIATAPNFGAALRAAAVLSVDYIFTVSVCEPNGDCIGTWKDGQQTWPTAQDRIELFRENGAWMARHTGPHAADIRRLFDTDILPCAFTDQAHPETVLQEIETLNPKMIIQVRL